MKKLFSKKYISRTLSYSLVIGLYLLLTLLIQTHNISSLIKSLLVPICCYIVAAIGLNLVVGYSGELSLGQAGFMSIGAFTSICVSGILSSFIHLAVLRLILSMLAGALVAGFLGFVIGIPVLKLKGDYLAIVTLAFGQIIVSLINNIYLGFDSQGFQFSFVNNTLSLGPDGISLLSGPMGATGIERIASFNAGIILVLLALVIVYNLLYSKFGRNIMACRDNRIAAVSVGINVTNTKMLAFVVSAMLAGAAGALYGLNYSTLLPAKFDYNLSIMILVYVVLGGLGNINGTIIATIILVLLPELLRKLQNYRMLIYSIILIVIMLVRNNETLNAYFERLKKKLRRNSGKEKNHDEER